MRGNITGYRDTGRVLVVNETATTIPAGYPVGIMDYAWVPDSSQAIPIEIDAGPPSKTAQVIRLPAVSKVWYNIAVTFNDCWYIGIAEEDIPPAVSLDPSLNVYTQESMKSVIVEGIVDLYVWLVAQGTEAVAVGDCLYFDKALDAAYIVPAGDVVDSHPRQVGVALSAATGSDEAVLVTAWIDQFPRFPQETPL